MNKLFKLFIVGTQMFSITPSAFSIMNNASKSNRNIGLEKSNDLETIETTINEFVNQYASTTVSTSSHSNDGKKNLNYTDSIIKKIVNGNYKDEISISVNVDCSSHHRLDGTGHPTSDGSGSAKIDFMNYTSSKSVNVEYGYSKLETGGPVWGKAWFWIELSYSWNSNQCLINLHLKTSASKKLLFGGTNSSNTCTSAILYKRVPNLHNRYSTFMNNFSNKTYTEESFVFNPMSRDDLFEDPTIKLNKLKEFYKSKILEYFNYQEVKNSKIYIPDDWDISIENIGEDTMLSFIYNDFFDKTKKITVKVNNKLFVKREDVIIDDTKKYWIKNIESLNRYFASDIQTVNNSNTQVINDLCDGIIKYSDWNNDILELPVITTMTKEQFLKLVLNETNLYSDDSIEFKINNNLNSLPKYSNGECCLSLKINDKLLNMFYESTKELYNKEFNINLHGFKTQFDIYKNNKYVDLTSRKIDWDNFYDDLESKNKIIDVSKENIDNFDLYLNNEEQIKNFIINKLILFENNNGQKLLDAKQQYLLATNLSKTDFISRQSETNNFIDKIVIENINYATGTLIFSFENLNFGDEWANDKKEIEGYSKTYKDADDRITYCLTGFKKHYNIGINKNKELDASKLIGQDPSTNLSSYYAVELENSILEKHNSPISYDELLDYLIQFEVNNASLGDGLDISNSKLLTTFLSKNTFLNKTEFKFTKNNIKTSEMLGEISGSFSGNKSIYQYNDDCSEISNYTKVESLTNSFFIKNLKQKILIKENTNKDIGLCETIDSTKYYKVGGDLKTLSIREFESELNYDQDKIIKMLFKSQNDKDTYDKPFIINGTIDEFSNQNNLSKSIVKSINLVNRNEAIGECDIVIEFNHVYGSFNDTEYEKDGISPPNLEIKLSGFKKNMRVQNNLISINKDQYNQEVNNALGKRIDNEDSITQEFIINNLIKYADKNQTLKNFILQTNLTQNEFMKYLLSDSTETPPIEINKKPVDGKVDGIIHLKEHSGISQRNSIMDSFSNETHFSIIGFDKTDILYESNKQTLDITYFTNNFERMNLADFNKEFVLERMIKYSDWNQSLSQAVLKTNLSKTNFLNSYLDDIQISKNQNESSAKVILITHDETGNKFNLESGEIINFLSSPDFKIFKTEKYQLKDNEKIDDIDEQYIIDNLFMFENLNTIVTQNKCLVTNVSKKEFLNTYLNHIELKSTPRDKFNNKLKFKINLKNPINNRLEYDFEIKIITNKSYIIDVQKNFTCPSSLLNEPINKINEEEIKSLIKTKDHNLQSYLFEINVNSIDLDDYVELSLIKNNDLGIITVNVKLLNSGNKSEDHFTINLSGFENDAIFIINNENVDLEWYDKFNNINSLSEINEDFIINNLIQFKDTPSANNIIGSINLNKADFMKLYKSMDIINMQNTLDVSINLNNSINTSNNSIRLDSIKFKINSNKNLNNKNGDTYIILLSTLIPILILVLFLMIYFIVKKIKQKKYHEEVDNEI